MLTAEQLREGIALAKRLKKFPHVPDLSVEPCGDGTELRLEDRAINRQGWLRAIFWVHERTRTIYIVDLFWKKTNKVTVADIHRINHRIRGLKALLATGGDPWKSAQ
jgi:phage-related protein